VAYACGCLSPPIPRPGAVDFAVNQQAEQIIFEVEPDGHIVAHVLIRYAGDPEKFAWIVPVPSVPELELSHAQAFGLIDQQTAPQVSASVQNICTHALYQCRMHAIPNCGPLYPTLPSAQAPMGFSGAAGAGSANFGAPGAQTPPPVMVYARQQVGSYDTVVFGAGDAMAAVEWLQTEGFIVNDTMTPYMQPYLDTQMLFVAAKLNARASRPATRRPRIRAGWSCRRHRPVRARAAAAEAPVARARLPAPACRPARPPSRACSRTRRCRAGRHPRMTRPTATAAASEPAAATRARRGCSR
jgi:hypothetical protein